MKIVEVRSSSALKACFPVLHELLMGYRILFDFVHGKHVYIDDLIVTRMPRSQGLGAILLKHAEEIAAKKRCAGLRLCTGVDRKDSQRFYERNGWSAKAFAYKKPLPI